MSQPSPSTPETDVTPAGGADTRGGTDTRGGAELRGEAEIRAELERVSLEKQQLFEKLARAQAEFANSRRRLEQDLDQSLQYANQSVLKSLLPLLDNLERALAVDPAKADAASVLQGVQVVRDQFEALLRSQQVEFVIPRPGDAFDPSKMEALLHVPSDQPPGSVAQVISRGYKLLGRTLRPAQVAVAKPKE